MTDEDVLTIPGIVVRRMPTYVVSRWNQYAEFHGKPRNTPNRTVVEGPNEKGHYVVEERRPVSEELAGKFMVTHVHGTGSTVRFNKKTDGVGDTIVEAYLNMKFT